MASFAGDRLTCFRGERLVFQGLGFTVESGCALVLTGPNGSGKSSLLRLMAGLLPAAAGNLTWNGLPIDGVEEPCPRIHYVGHADAVKPMLTVVENVSFWAQLRSGGSNDDEKVNAALRTFDMASLADMPGRFLSAGQKRRVNLARIVATPADLWLLDEPTTALDQDSIRRLETAITTHQSAGGMVIVSTHTDLDLANATGLAVDKFMPTPWPVMAA
ncbi:MAG: heme ABC exporter ATP-binding protein CcmA [Rhodospirillales bacterium]